MLAADMQLIKVCWIPIFKGKKLILAGDPMQLPPTILSLGNHGPNKTKKPPAPAAEKPKIGENAKAAQDAASDMSLSSSAEDAGSETDESPAKSAATAKPTPPTKRRTGLRPPRTLETTLFDRLERMHGPGVKRMLDTQYRFVELLRPAVPACVSNVWQNARADMRIPVSDALRGETAVAPVGRDASPARPPRD